MLPELLLCTHKSSPTRGEGGTFAGKVRLGASGGKMDIWAKVKGHARGLDE